MPSTQITIDEILEGTTFGPMQSVGQMQLIPLLSAVDDERFAPPDVTLSNRDYGTIDVMNEDDRPTIVPPGVGFVTKQLAQDHAIGGGALIPAKRTRTINTAMCIQETQGGYIRQEKGLMTSLPARLRAVALQTRHENEYSRLWEPVRRFNASMGVNSRGAHVNYFLDHFKRELEEFVAQFEVLPRQVGAIVLIGGQIAGVERAPSHEYWLHVWETLVRVCYGSLAIEHQKKHPANRPPATRAALPPHDGTLQGLEFALQTARQMDAEITAALVQKVGHRRLQSATVPDEQMDDVRLVTVGSNKMSGQIVTTDNGANVTFASICMTGG